MDNANTATEMDITIESRAIALPEQARSIVVVDNESMERANQFNLDLRQVMKDITEWFAPKVEAANRTHKLLTAERAATLKPLEEASAYIAGQVKAYLRKVKEEEERQAAILREQARKEEEERRLAQAAELEEMGLTDEANEVLETESIVVAPVPVIETPKVDKRLYRTQTKVRITDRAKFLQSVPYVYLLEALNEQAWAAIESGMARKAKALGSQFKIAGCEVYEA